EGHRNHGPGHGPAALLDAQSPVGVSDYIDWPRSGAGAFDRPPIAELERSSLGLLSSRQPRCHSIENRQTVSGSFISLASAGQRELERSAVACPLMKNRTAGCRS